MAPQEPSLQRMHRAELAVEGWRLRWALFSVVWGALVLLVAAWLWPSLAQGRPPRDVLAGVGLVAAGPPVLDYLISRAIARLLQRRLHSPS